MMKNPLIFLFLLIFMTNNVNALTSNFSIPELMDDLFRDDQDLLLQSTNTTERPLLFVGTSNVDGGIFGGALGASIGSLQVFILYDNIERVVLCDPNLQISPYQSCVFSRFTPQSAVYFENVNESMINTYLHELIHYEIAKNNSLSQLLDAELGITYFNGSISNVNYFVNLTNTQLVNSGYYPLSIYDTLNLDHIFFQNSAYDVEDYDDEIKARIGAFCLDITRDSSFDDTNAIVSVPEAFCGAYDLEVLRQKLSITHTNLAENIRLGFLELENPKESQFDSLGMALAVFFMVVIFVALTPLFIFGGR